MPEIHEVAMLSSKANANVRFFRVLIQLIQDVVPSDPARDEYRQGNTMGPDYRN